MEVIFESFGMIEQFCNFVYGHLNRREREAGICYLTARNMMTLINDKVILISKTPEYVVILINDFGNQGVAITGNIMHPNQYNDKLLFLKFWGMLPF